MTEDQWLTYYCLGPRLEYVRKRASERKLRLLGVACCRRIRDLLETPCRDAVDVAERFADGMATAEELAEAAVAIEEPARSVAAMRTDRLAFTANRAAV